LAENGKKKGEEEVPVVVEEEERGRSLAENREEEKDGNGMTKLSLSFNSKITQLPVVSSICLKTCVYLSSALYTVLRFC